MVLRVEGDLERGGNSPEGASSPRARRVFRVAAPAPRTRWRSTRGAPGPAVCGAAEGFWPWAFLCLGPRPCGVGFVTCGFDCLLLLFLERGGFPRY
jgi:hypothetical protein